MLAQRINFQQSRIYWNHGTNKSHGAFKVEAVLKVLDESDYQEATFGLAAGVLAGNMYVSGRLVKDPIYYFQVAASNDKHVIFRSYSHSNRASWRKWFKRFDKFDTKGKNEIFSSLNLDLKSEDAVKVDRTYQNIKQHYMSFACFSCKVIIPLKGERKMELEFPVKHINILPERGMFQVETGPVLFVEPDWLSKSVKEILDALVPSFVHFNQFNSADFSIDFPFGIRKSFGRGKMLVKPVSCDIQLYSDNLNL